MGARCTGAALAAVAACALAAVASGKTATPVLSSHAVAGVRFGTPKPQAVKVLTRLLGSSSRQFVSSGCGPKYTEVEWGHLYVEFRRGRLSGFRYLRGGWEGHPAQPPARGRGLVPTLVTSGGVSLASTLGEVRDRYGTLTIVGTDRWRSRDGLVFYVSYQGTQPVPPTSRITEIKYGTCGDW